MRLTSLLKPRRSCKDLIKRYYPRYEDKGSIYEKILERHLEASDIIIDAGCGRGAETPVNYKERVRQAIGLDISSAISQNRTLDHRIHGSVYYIPIKDNSVDKIVSQELVEHLSKPERFFSEVSRVLKPKGKFIMMVPNLLGWRTMVSKLTPYKFHKLMNKQLYGIDEKDVFPTYYKANNLAKIKELLGRVGMRVTESHFFEETPKTLTFSIPTIYLEIFYTSLLRKHDRFKHLREYLITISEKN